ncbi:ribonuclease III [Methylobacillus flagellatus]|uniref:ribonuclease III n=1 Tax=Methylobacillus flagellatus TaxID=405 RepID=UPI002570208B|nr:ribonuclease III [Methylobacillus flagellatus]
MVAIGLLRQLGHDFANPALLTQALTHRSLTAANNERLEFLGDGVLNCVVAHLLYQQYPKLPEGDLSRLRAYLVKEQTLSEIARSLNLGEALLLGEGELKSGGWRRPSVLADAVEAIIGAVFMDAGYSAAETLVVRLYQPLLHGLDPKTIGKDSKSLLQEYLQGQKMDVPEYTVVSTEGEAHCQTFRVECFIAGMNIHTYGEGSSRRIAEQQAAQLAFSQLPAVRKVPS